MRRARPSIHQSKIEMEKRRNEEREKLQPVRALSPTESRKGTASARWDQVHCVTIPAEDHLKNLLLAFTDLGAMLPRLNVTSRTMWIGLLGHAV